MKFIKKIIYKLFRENSTLQGFVAHTPIGIVNVFLAVYVHWVIALLFGIGFIAYEFMHEWRLRDDSWNDIAGFLLGLVIGSIICWVI